MSSTGVWTHCGLFKSWSSAGNAFRALGPACEKQRSPNLSCAWWDDGWDIHVPLEVWTLLVASPSSHWPDNAGGRFANYWTDSDPDSTSFEACNDYWFCLLFLHYWGDGGGGHWLVRMEWRPARWSMCLLLLIFPCTIKSRSFLLAPAHPGGPGKWP